MEKIDNLLSNAKPGQKREFSESYFYGNKGITPDFVFGTTRDLKYENCPTSEN
jgi:hypothetical protein